MPPSAGACQTTDAELKPDCGRAGPRSSIITAIGRWAAIAGGTMRPSSGAGTRTGVGAGVGLGAGVGRAVATTGWDGAGVAAGELADAAAATVLGPGPVRKGATFAAARPAMVPTPSASRTITTAPTRLTKRFATTDGGRGGGAWGAGESFRRAGV